MSTLGFSVPLVAFFWTGGFVTIRASRVEGQETDPKKLREALDSDDIAERERSLRELKKTPLERLSLLEDYLKSTDAELRIRIQEAFSEALFRSLGRNIERLSLKSVAPRDVMDPWTKDGSDLSRVPRGYEVIARPNHVSLAEEYGYLQKERILVAPLITNEDVKSITPVEYETDTVSLWGLLCDLTDKGTFQLGQAAAVLHDQQPPGMIAIILDGKLLSTPVVRSSNLGGSITIPTQLRTREETLVLAKHISGCWYQLNFWIHWEKDSAPPTAEVVGAVSSLPGFSEAMLLERKGADARWGGTVNLRSTSLIDLWVLLRSKGFSLFGAK